MERSELQFTVRQTIKFSKSTLHNESRPASKILPTLNNARNFSEDHHEDTEPDTFGGIIRDGQMAWIANGAQIEVISLKTGCKVASYKFENSIFSNTQITYVSEIEAPECRNICLLAISIQCSPALTVTGGGLLCLFSVHGSRLLRCIEFDDRITSCTYISSSACAQNRLMPFDGAVVVGTDRGKLVMVDLRLKECRDALYGETKQIVSELQVRPSCVIVSDASYNDMEANHERSAKENGHFCIQFEDSQLGQTAPILSLLVLPPLFTIAAGLADGRLIFYDLCDLVPFHVAHPPQTDAPLLKFAFMEPSDDPRACCYVWAFHACANNQAVAVMHSLMFERKVIVDQDYVYKNFQTCSPRLTLPIADTIAFPIACQSISKSIVDEDSLLSLCLLAWAGPSSACACLFDLNQWYKEQMPNTCEYRNTPSYLVNFPLDRQHDSVTALDIWVNSKTVTPFNSIQRPEEHFHPSSLNFDCVLLTPLNGIRLHWPGLQNKILELFSASGPNAILDPDQCFEEMICAALVPQFSDYNQNVHLTTKLKQDFLLSMALEYNCVGLLKECAKVWADGSHLGRQPYDGLSLSTLTDWIWDRAATIKNRCNNLCSSLFDHSGLTIDYRSRKNLSHYARQLKLLSDLLTMIITTCQQYIPSNVIETLHSQRNSIQMAAEYQEILQWLLNMGLLPEGVWTDSVERDLCNAFSTQSTIIPYPYRVLRNYYMAQRRKFCEIDRSLISAKTKYCRILYIDAFIENECNAPLLRHEWKQGSGCTSDGLYPPPSLQCMLRTLLVPGVSIESKYMLFVYMFLDLNMALNDERYAAVVQNLIKFPAVFKLNPALIKTTQAFWNLDHCEFETAVDELISPLSQDRHISQWQQELLIESLLVQDVPHLALRAFRAPRPPISASLEIKTLLVNNLVAEAFQLQRTRADPRLLQEFFQGCHEHSRWNAVLDLALTPAEELALGKYLRSNPSQFNSSLHFLYLLQRDKYIEANSFVDQLHSGKAGASKRHGNDLDTPSTILSAYKITMTPATRKLAELYHSVKDTLNAKLNKAYAAPLPLSSNLLRSSANAMAGIYHRTVLSTEQTTELYWFNQRAKKCSLIESEVPFFRAPQYSEMFGGAISLVRPPPQNVISDPVAYVPNKKRRMVQELDDGHDSDSIKEYEGPRKRQRLDSVQTSQSAKELAANRINATLLTSFRDRSGPSILSTKWSTVNDITMADDEQLKNAEMPETLLSTPIVKSFRLDGPQQKELGSSVDRVSTPHSILKVKGIESSAASTCSRSYSPFLFTGTPGNSVTESEEKSIRFKLPQSADGTAEMDEPIVVQCVSATPDPVLVATASTTFKPNTSYLGATTRSSIRSCDVSVSSNSGDEFYSPNTSLTCVEIPTTGEVVCCESTVVAEHPCSRESSREPMDQLVDANQSNTGNMYPRGRRSYRSRSRTPDADNKHSASEMNVGKHATPRRSKPLSRMVLETNAVKASIVAIQNEDEKVSIVQGNSDMELVSVEADRAVDQDVASFGYRQNVLSEMKDDSMKIATEADLLESDGNAVMEMDEVNYKNVVAVETIVPVVEEVCVKKTCFVTTIDHETPITKPDVSSSKADRNKITQNLEESAPIVRENFVSTTKEQDSEKLLPTDIVAEPPLQLEPYEKSNNYKNDLPVVEQVCVKKTSYVTTSEDDNKILNESNDDQIQFHNLQGHSQLFASKLQASTPKTLGHLVPMKNTFQSANTPKFDDATLVSESSRRRNLFNETDDEAMASMSKLKWWKSREDLNESSVIETYRKNVLVDSSSDSFTTFEMSVGKTESDNQLNEEEEIQIDVQPDVEGDFDDEFNEEVEEEIEIDSDLDVEDNFGYKGELEHEDVLEIEDELDVDDEIDLEDDLEYNFNAEGEFASEASSAEYSNEIGASSQDESSSDKSNDIEIINISSSSSEGNNSRNKKKESMAAEENAFSVANKVDEEPTNVNVTLQTETKSTIESRNQPLISLSTLHQNSEQLPVNVFENSNEMQNEDNSDCTTAAGSVDVSPKTLTVSNVEICRNVIEHSNEMQNEDNSNYTSAVGSVEGSAQIRQSNVGTSEPLAISNVENSTTDLLNKGCILHDITLESESIDNMQTAGSSISLPLIESPPANVLNTAAIFENSDALEAADLTEQSTYGDSSFLTASETDCTVAAADKCQMIDTLQSGIDDSGMQVDQCDNVTELRPLESCTEIEQTHNSSKSKDSEQPTVNVGLSQPQVKELLEIGHSVGDHPESPISIESKGQSTENAASSMPQETESIETDLTDTNQAEKSSVAQSKDNKTPIDSKSGSRNIDPAIIVVENSAEASNQCDSTMELRDNVQLHGKYTCTENIKTEDSSDRNIATLTILSSIDTIQTPKTRKRSQSTNIDSLSNNIQAESDAVISPSVSNLTSRRGSSEPPFEMSSTKRTTRRSSMVVGDTFADSHSDVDKTPRRRTMHSNVEQAALSTPRTTRARSLLSEIADSPSQHTRSAKKMFNEEANVASTPRKSSRKSTSRDADETDSIVSARSTRSKASLVAESDDGKSTARSTRSKASLIVADSDDGKSIASSKSGKRKRTKQLSLHPIDEDQSGEQVDDYSDSRRLTRHQKLIHSKVAIAMAANRASVGFKRKFDEVSPEKTDELSDTETVVSVESSVSKTSQQRKRCRPKKTDSSSIASSTDTSVTSRPKRNLTPIEETADEIVEIKGAVVRRRKASSSSSRK